MNNSFSQTYLLLTERFIFNNKSIEIQYFNHLKSQEKKEQWQIWKGLKKWWYEVSQLIYIVFFFFTKTVNYQYFQYLTVIYIYPKVISVCLFGTWVFVFMNARSKYRNPRDRFAANIDLEPCQFKNRFNDFNISEWNVCESLNNEWIRV